jgi:hypothetical protein
LRHLRLSLRSLPLSNDNPHHAGQFEFGIRHQKFMHALQIPNS